MKSILLTISSLLFVVLLTLTPAAVTAETVMDTQGVVIKADIMTHDQIDDVIRASGAVQIVWKGVTLMAIDAAYNQRTQTITASGNVALIKGGDILRGDRLVLDTVNGRGEMDNSTLYFRKGGNFHMSGKKIKRDEEDEFVVQDGNLTTCDAPVPSWKFSAEELNLNLLGYATGRNVIFHIKDVPVLYLPWIAFPVVRDRQSGLLFPRVGWSNKKGAELDLIYYWAISPSRDVTINLDSLTKRGLGTGVDYRYLRSKNSEGTFGGYLIYDLQQERWRGQMTQKHREIFSPDMSLRTAINHTADRTFLGDYGDKSGDYNRQSNDSTASFLKTWQHYALTANLRYSEDYYAADNSHTLQTLPDVGLSAVRQQLFATPVYFDMDLSASNFYRERGPSGQRLYAFPRLTLITGLPGYLHASVYAGTHLRAYTSQNMPTGNTYNENDARILPEVGARLSSSFSKVYEIAGENLKKLRHEVTPELSYSYVPDQDQSRLPFYDYNDRLINQNSVYFELTSQLGGKFQYGETSEYRDLSRISLKQGYSIEGTRRDLLTMVDANRHWTDVILESETWLHPQARLTFDARYNIYDNHFSSVAPGVEFADKLGNLASASYRMSRNTLEYLEARISTKLIRPWTFGYTTRYSFDRGDILESVYSTEYRHQCWSINLAFRDRPGNKSYLFNFTLAGLTGK